MMGIGQALSEGTQLRRRRPPAQRGACSSTSSRRCPTPRRSPSSGCRRTPTDGGPRGSKGVAEAPNVATAAAIANALAKLTGAPLRQLPMTPERVWEHMQEVRLVSYTAAHTLDEALAALAARRPPGRRRLRPRRRRPPGQVPAAREPRRHPRRRRARRHRSRSTAARSCSARSSTHADVESNADVRGRLDRRSPTAARSWARPRRATSARSAATS